jgi:hypothetical protein
MFVTVIFENFAGKVSEKGGVGGTAVPHAFLNAEARHAVRFDPCLLGLRRNQRNS